MARLRIGGFRPERRRYPGSSNEIRVKATSPTQKALIRAMMILFGAYVFVTGEFGVGSVDGAAITGVPALVMGGGLVAWGLYLTVMNAFTSE